ncbi:hypothetical protein EDB81DRAFT_814218 [Dactylonectria macrodidyma]|uniref:Knr4/Smi1-like domain-containing protein n=1 Tax=Dactylonectria macrodidyma TaxID=307937 RepID=A0A9P9DMJ0_9HYPO|nr:hypothetical protein EDB81DRAFT_814218 [Dactylonectria macrodidyma]
MVPVMLAMHSQPLPSEQDVEEFSKRFSIPDDYKSFLQRHNGGIPQPNTIRPDDNVRVINHLLALVSPRGFGESIENYLGLYKDRIPKSNLPIASAGSGDLLLIDLQDTGSIYYWDHNFEADSEIAENYYKNLDKIADSFSDLLTTLHEQN